MRRSKPFIDKCPDPEAKVIELATDQKIGPNHPCFLVAEIGQNHQGDTYTALRLITEAHRAGFDAIKFCKRHLPSELTTEARNRPYGGPQSFGPTYGQHREALELSVDDYAHLKDRMRYNDYREVLFATACDRHSVFDLEATISPPLYKVASRDLDNWPLLETIAETKKPVILSTGMVRGWEEIDAAVEIIRKQHDQVIVMYCVSEYPTPDDHVHLGRLGEYQLRYGPMIGFSDHTVGIHLAQAAVVLGAVVIEKHVTLARAMKGTDHAASLEPEGMRRFVRNIRSVEKALDESEAWASSEEIEANRKKLGRSLVSRRDICAGETITEDMVCLKSPGDGVHWPERAAIVGKVARVHIPADVTLQRSDVAEVPETD
jgi:sialic acid synthase SpsE